MNLNQKLACGTRILRHRHAQPYAAVVLQGSYEEAGDNGRWHSLPGDVLVHPPFTSHMNHVSSRTAVLNLPLPATMIDTLPHHRTKDPDLLARVAERDPVEASNLLLEQLLPGRASRDEPVDELAAQLAALTAPSIDAWSQHAGLRRETTFRRFRAAYGTSPTRYRVEARARLAWREIVHRALPFTEVAVNCGFSDQAHMSRAVRALTGHSPGHWRRLQHSFKKPY